MSMLLPALVWGTFDERIDLRVRPSRAAVGGVVLEAGEVVGGEGEAAKCNLLP
jgi:hypothetical protein